MAHGTRNTLVTSLSVPFDAHDWAKEAAAREGMSFSSWVSRLIAFERSRDEAVATQQIRYRPARKAS